MRVSGVDGANADARALLRLGELIGEREHASRSVGAEREQPAQHLFVPRMNRRQVSTRRPASVRDALPLGCPRRQQAVERLVYVRRVGTPGVVGVDLRASDDAVLPDHVARYSGLGCPDPRGPHPRCARPLGAGRDALAAPLREVAKLGDEKLSESSRGRLCGSPSWQDRVDVTGPHLPIWQDSHESSALELRTTGQMTR
jgi:hypothetical protein